MSTFTLAEIEKALGPGYKLEKLGDDEARVLAGGGDIAYIDVDSQVIEAEIRVTGYAPGATPDLDKAVARSADLRRDWEDAGFDVDECGTVDFHWYQSDPETKHPHVTFEVRQSFQDLESAVRVLRWLRNAESQV